MPVLISPLPASLPSNRFEQFRVHSWLVTSEQGINIWPEVGRLNWLTLSGLGQVFFSLSPSLHRSPNFFLFVGKNVFAVQGCAHKSFLDFWSIIPMNNKEAEPLERLSYSSPSSQQLSCSKAHRGPSICNRWPQGWKECPKPIRWWDKKEKKKLSGFFTLLSQVICCIQKL